MKFLDELISLIDISINPESDNNIMSGNIIASGYDANIDSDRELVEKAHEWILNYRDELASELGNPNIKIKFTNNSGYFIELSKSKDILVPDDFIQRQTLTQVVRYTTLKLQDFEYKLQNAQSSLSEKEYHCFLGIRNSVMEHFSNIYKLSRNISNIDFLSNGAYISKEKGYTSPKMGDKFSLEIIDGRHPVIEENINQFISNDICMKHNDFVHVISGPNMGGKSTFLRQNALMILMGHMGYDIPASSSQMSVIDSIFSRVGSGDNLFLGQSTFMVEMQEISYILHNSTSKSFVIIDEIGRGTSTYDGMSLAWSILKHNHDRIGAKTLFATHYHEISDYSKDLKGVSNYSVAVGENNENIVFLRKVIPGAMKKSYGIEVAKLAGIPKEILTQAKETMLELQNKGKFQQLAFISDDSELVESKVKDDNEQGLLLNMLEDIQIESISPIDAMLALKQLQEQVKKQK